MLDQTLQDWAAGSWQGERSDVLRLFEAGPAPAAGTSLSTTAEVGRPVTWQHYHRDGTTGARTGVVWAEAPLRARADAAWWVVPDSPHPADLQPAVYVVRSRGQIYATGSGPDATAARAS
jgi:hypothetical protein